MYLFMILVDEFKRPSLPFCNFLIARVTASPLNWTPWPQSANELYLPSDRRLSVKLVPVSTDRGCLVVSATDSYGRILGILDRILSFILLNTQFSNISSTKRDNFHASFCFWVLHPVAIVTIPFWGCRHSQQYLFQMFFYFLISFYLYPLHVSAPMDHPQVEYTTSKSLEATMPTTDPLFLLG
jgi:hypothetical protein